MMERLKDYYLREWDTYVLSSRRKYFFERFPENQKIGGLYSFSHYFKWLKADVYYVINRLYNISKQLWVFGFIIRKNYDLSFFTQFWRMIYVCFVIRQGPIQFRKRFLFEDESWKCVEEYDYGQVYTQKLLSEGSYPDEISTIEDKFLFFESCRFKGIPTPEILAVFSSEKQIYPKDEFEIPSESLFIKERKGGKGINVKKFIYKDEFYYDAEKKSYSVGEVLKFIKKASRQTDIIVQKNLVNHSIYDAFTNSGLATCRIVTIKSENETDIIPVFAALKMPVGTSDVDNFARGNLLSNISINTGKLEKAVTFLPVDGKFEFDYHPDTKQKIKETKLPMWEELLQFTIETHKKFKTLAIGWDVCVTGQGILVIEGNIKWGSSLYECALKEPFRNTNYPVHYSALKNKNISGTDGSKR